MATPNYGFEKRQRELAKKKKKEDKLRAKAAPQRPDAYAQQSQDNYPEGSAAAPQAPDGDNSQPG